MEPKITEKAWEPILEEKILKKWDDTGINDFVIQNSNYTIDTPPPYPSGRPWHIGAASHYAQICLLYTSPSPRDGLLSRMPSSA